MIPRISIMPRVKDILWQRRYLLIVPILVLGPLSVGGALLFQTTYAARTLMLLQESNRNPLNKDSAPRSLETIQAQAAGLRALMASEYVLGEVLNDLDPNSQADPKAYASKIDGLRRALTVNWIGTDFLEFRLTGNSPHGLGKQLETVVFKLVEALNGQSGQSIGEMLVSNKKQELDRAEANYRRLNEQLTNMLGDSLPAVKARLSNLNSHLSDISTDLAKADADLSEIRTQLAIPDLSGERARAELVQAGKTAALTAAPSGAQGANELLQDAHVQRLLQFLSLEEKRDALQKEAETTRASIAALSNALADYKSVEQQLTQSQYALSSAQQSYEAVKKRFGNPPQGKRESTVLVAPERMVIIDVARDPEHPVRSRLFLVLAGLAASMFLGVGLVIMAEALDQTVRYPEEFVEVTGVPIIAQLPRRMG
jgi:uncharacterized protein involved in exopolysaccharide biosynthesis